MKILITDDERLIRLSLLSMLEELYPRVHHISQAKDGEEMIRMVEKEFMPQKVAGDSMVRSDRICGI